MRKIESFIDVVVVVKVLAFGRSVLFGHETDDDDDVWTLMWWQTFFLKGVSACAEVRF